MTKQGVVQSQRLSQVLEGVGIDRIVSSPFARAVQSIEPLAARLNLEIETDPRLEQRKLSAIDYSDWHERLKATFDDFRLSFPGGESNGQAMVRAETAIGDIMRSRKGHTVAVITHGNLAVLILKSFDPSLGFSTWEEMKAPDVFRVTSSGSGFIITHVWSPAMDA